MFAKEGRGFKIIENELVGEEVPLRYERTNIGELILQALRSKPNFTGLIDGESGKCATYQEMMEKSVRCALWLKRQGIQAGDHVGICAGNLFNVYVPLFATLYINGVATPWDDELTTMTARYFLTLTNPKIVFTNAACAKYLKEAAELEGLEVKLVLLEELAEFESLDEILSSEEGTDVAGFECTKPKTSDETCMICSSSGTTGFPKATELSHFSQINYLYLIDILDMKDQVLISLPPIRWQYGISMVIKAVLDYTPRIVVKHYEELDVLCQFIEKYKVTMLIAGPGVLVRMIKFNTTSKYRLPSLKTCLVGGSPFKKEQQETARNLLPHVQIIQCYGMTDIGGICHHQRRDSKAGSCGPVCTGVRVKLVDPTTGVVVGPNQTAEVWIKAPFVMKAYYKNPEGTKAALDADGYIHSGDLAYYDEDGELFIVGRISEFLIYKSINVPPIPIEAYLENHPAVLEAAVVGVAHETDDEHPIAFVRRVPGKQVTEQELIDLVDRNLEYYSKLRAGLVFVSEFPRTTTGKISRRKLKEIAQILWKI